MDLDVSTEAQSKAKLAKRRAREVVLAISGILIGVYILFVSVPDNRGWARAGFLIALVGVALGIRSIYHAVVKSNLK